ncbi:MAG: Regulator protein [Promethearchaeota archaeon]|jgi:predicted regulator of Ras-like GTPase activity (Roadblock/LC7/MglB family)|nr:MAG: Regulator protein [Candidatus Lokiarchaeota archaeon]
MNYSEDERMLKKILNAIINSTAGLRYAIIIDDTGITIMSQSKFKLADDEISVEKIGAIGGAVFMAGEEQGQILNYGKIDLQITEYGKGMLFSMKVGKGVLCLASDKNVNIGFVRAVMKKWAPKLGKILDRYLESDQDAINEELKELFNSDTISML